MKPPAVSYGPSGSTRPVNSAKSSRFSRPSTEAGRPRPRLVVLVADVADDLLDQILQRDDAVCAAVLVDDHREMVSLAAHLGQCGEHILRAGQLLDLANKVADRPVALAAGAVE